MEVTFYNKHGERFNLKIDDKSNAYEGYLSSNDFEGQHKVSICFECEGDVILSPEEIRKIAKILFMSK